MEYEKRLAGLAGSTLVLLVGTGILALLGSQLAAPAQRVMPQAGSAIEPAPTKIDGQPPEDQGKAITYLQKVLQSQPANAAAHYELGNLLRQSGDLEGASKEFASSLHLRPL